MWYRHIKTRREWFHGIIFWDDSLFSPNTLHTLPVLWKKGMIRGMGFIWDSYGIHTDPWNAMKPRSQWPNGSTVASRLWIEPLCRCASNQAALMTSKFVPCTSTLNSQPVANAFRHKSDHHDHHAGKACGWFHVFFGKMRGGPFYGLIIGQRWSTILGAALVIFGALAGMRPNRK